VIISSMDQVVICACDGAPVVSQCGDILPCACVCVFPREAATAVQVQ
jgi:hypothetical protein